MEFNKIFFLFLVLISTKCFSQDKGNSDIIDVTKATFLNPGLAMKKELVNFNHSMHRHL